MSQNVVVQIAFLHEALAALITSEFTNACENVKEIVRCSTIYINLNHKLTGVNPFVRRQICFQRECLQTDFTFEFFLFLG